MCGISGIISLDGTPVQPSRLKRMNHTIRHRGPDGDGFVFYSGEVFSTAFGNDTPENVRHATGPSAPKQFIDQLNGKYHFGFGHRRLAILDLGENGHQPLCDPSGKIWITYNGEIYNYLELREKLKAKGHSFRTRTDTEVILAAYREWGTECVKEFNGMWAFVIFDAEKNRFFGSRDRFGVKPFYYYKDKSRFLFASEQKALLANPDVSSGIDTPALAEYFLAGKIEQEAQGIFKNIIELFPSCSFSIDGSTGEFKTWNYYSLEFSEEYQDFNTNRFEQYRDQAEQLLKEAIRIRLRSDVPVGSCLSGGIDSSAIVGITKDLMGPDAKGLNTFTAVFPGTDYDESRWAQMVAEQAGTVSHTVQPTREDLIKDLEDLVWCQDAPIWSTSTYAQYRVMKLVKDNGIKVILDGQGGDELFAGYDPYYTWYIGDYLHRFRLGKALGAMFDFSPFPGNISALTKNYLKLKFIHRLPANMEIGIMSSYFKDIAYLDKGLVDLYKEKLRQTHLHEPRTLNGILHKEFVNTRLKTYLRCEDRCSMHHSVESRTPFADDKALIEFAFKVPGTYKIHKGIRKYLLREAVRKYIPAQVYSRQDKLGYSTPNNRWVSEMRDELRPYFTESLRPYIQLDKLLRDYDAFFDIKDKPENGRIFKFMLFAVWMKVFGLK